MKSVNYIYYKDVPLKSLKNDGVNVLLFNQLSDEAKIKARLGLIEHGQHHLAAKIAIAKELFKNNLHIAINDKSHISRLVGSMNLIKTLSNIVKSDALIVANLCNFLADGTYIYYMKF